MGEGHTLPPRQSHAEIVALQQAGEEARGGILYLTLEPCCYYGRTPPCTTAIIEAGIDEVHIAISDPNPRVNGRGLTELEKSGISVHLGEREEQALTLYEAFAKYITTVVPFVTAKFAMSLDGKIATHTGDSHWVTGETARRRVHDIRSECDAIMVGVNTVLRDDPKLTARDEAGHPLSRQPLRVVIDSGARTPPTSVLFKEPGCTLVAVAEATEAKAATLTEAGAEVAWFSDPVSRRVDLQALLTALGRREVVSLLVEGGGTLLGSLFDQGLVDKVLAFIAPRVVGGREAPSPVEGHGVGNVSEAIGLERVTVEHVGEDLLVVGYPSRG